MSTPVHQIPSCPRGSRELGCGKPTRLRVTLPVLAQKSQYAQTYSSTSLANIVIQLYFIPQMTLNFHIRTHPDLAPSVPTPTPIPILCFLPQGKQMLGFSCSLPSEETALYQHPLLLCHAHLLSLFPTPTSFSL